MSETTESLWSQYPNFSDADLRLLVSVTAQVLLDSQEEAQFPPDLLSISTSAAARQVLPDLREIDPAFGTHDVRRGIEDDATARIICLAILEISKSPELARHIETAFKKERLMMLPVEPLLLVAPLIILAIKIQKIQFHQEVKEGGKSKRITIQFSEAKDVLKTAVGEILSRVRS
jgi:hypothetical protein